jgi:molybdopterin/thiamine biosynthesis adenylyltransferase/rhodanese-related sulfurtransferase
MTPLEVTVEQARQQLQAGIPLVDIRTDAERLLGAAEGAQPMTPAELRERCAVEAGQRVNLLCSGGARSLVLAAVLKRQGLADARSVAGGFERWQAAGLPLAEADSSRREATERYARQVVMPHVGLAGQEKLGRARVLLAGLGGLNSPAALYLAAAGVGTLGLLDDDRVDRSNLQRQVLYGEAAIGEAKTRAASRRLRDLNPDVATELLETRVDADNAGQLCGNWDVVVDGTDNFAARYALNRACVAAGVPLVYGAVMRFQGQVSVFWPSHARARAPCLHCLLPEEASVQAPPSCAEAGVLGVVPGLIGSLQAAETLKLLLERGEALVGQLLMIDALTMEFRKTRIQRNPACTVCGRGS